MKDVSLEILKNYLNQIHPIPNSEWLDFASHLKIQTYQKGQHLLYHGQNESKVRFLTKGAVRVYYTNSDGQEFNHRFMFENSLVASYTSLLRKSPSLDSIEALEDIILLEMEFIDIERFYDQHSCWERLGRLTAEKNYLDKAIRESWFLLKDTTERYLSMKSVYPEIEKRIPQYHMASFLGVTPSSLNKILKKIKSLETGSL